MILKIPATISYLYANERIEKQIFCSNEKTFNLKISRQEIGIDIIFLCHTDLLF